jgi:jumonji domain-containing protein 7
VKPCLLVYSNVVNTLYSVQDGSFGIEPSDPPSTVPWVSVDPEQPGESDRFPLYHAGPPALHCVVKAGELLYLPSMYYHHVKQEPDEQGRTIAINFWYDMHFDVKYAYYKFAEKLAGALAARECRHD